MATRMVLVPGFWLGAWAWDEVADDLRARGNDVQALTLPGLDPADPDRLSATLAAQAQAIVDAVPAGETAVLVSHSGGAAPAYLATDVAPDRFHRAIYVDSAPIPNGYIIDATLADAGPEWQLPDWPELEAAGNSLVGLDEAALARFRDRAVSEPTTIASGPLQLSDSPARWSIPTTIICNSFTTAEVEKLRDSGQVPAFTELTHLTAHYLDLPTGHWPMWSEPKKLADLLHTIANP
ncbi:alpha/beta fold hydrolase [Nocardia sp. NPDC049149]|uniref:alpha/beta fold hydrolase n=1 Tax=Nocardia sp. NPDC049149 TaxID=3364315 RepID=UPI00371073DA